MFIAAMWSAEPANPQEPHRAIRPDGRGQVTVADTGPGVPDDVKEAIFARFEWGNDLSICRMLTARYGGRIKVEDRVAGHAIKT